jgi:serine/threonine-protein kinase
MGTNKTLNKARILCVDDDPGILRALKWVFEKDYDIFLADSGKAGLNVVQSNDFDVVISDLRMPGMTGVEFLSTVRQIKPHAIRILLTGYADMDAIVGSINDGEVFRYIQKPWDIPELKRIVAEAVSIARSLHNGNEKIELKQYEPQILIMQDDPALISLIQSVVAQPDRTLVAINVAEAIVELDQSDRIGVIVSDLYLGGYDVSRLLKVIKSKAPEITAVVLSSRSDSEDVINLINQGQVYRFMFKPVKRGALKLLIQSALDKHISLMSDSASKLQYRVDKLDKAEIDSLLKDVQAQAEQRAFDIELHDKGFLQRFSIGLTHLFGGLKKSET